MGMKSLVHAHEKLTTSHSGVHCVPWGRGRLARVGFASGSMPEQRPISCGYVLLRFATQIEGAAKRLQVGRLRSQDDAARYSY